MMPYSHILPYMLRRSLVQLRELVPIPVVLPPGYNVNARCEFHSGAPGHSIKNCKDLKYKVRDLIDSKAITFTPNVPNINNNIMPPHNKTNVNMVEMDNGRRLITYVDELKTPLVDIKNVLLESDLFPICTTTCEECLIDPQWCKILKTAIQNLMNQGFLLIDFPSMIEEVSTLEVPYDEVLPLQIPWSLSQMTLSVTPIVPMVITIPTSFPTMTL